MVSSFWTSFGYGVLLSMIAKHQLYQFALSFLPL
jgi:hypothetical protein